MEQCAYISASRLRGLRHLTAGMDTVTLARTTKVGDVLYVTAQVRGAARVVWGRMMRGARG